MGLTPVPDEDEFGHGFLLAGAMFIHMLGMRSRFELLDFSSHMLRVASHEANQQTPESGSAAMAIGMVDAVSQSLASSAVLLSRQASERASKRTNERTNERTMLVLVGSSVSVAFRCLFRVPFLGDRLLRASSFHHASNGLSLALSRLRPTPPDRSCKRTRTPCSRQRCATDGRTACASRCSRRSSLSPSTPPPTKCSPSTHPSPTPTSPPTPVAPT